MNWFARVKKSIKDIFSNDKKTPKSELEKSNWGRDFGWFIEFEGEKIGELVDAEFYDMFWVKYKIVPYSSFEKVVLDYENWASCSFQYQNKHYLQYPKNAFFGMTIDKENDNYTIAMRGLYLEAIEK